MKDTTPEVEEQYRAMLLQRSGEERAEDGPFHVRNGKSSDQGVNP